MNTVIGRRVKVIAHSHVESKKGAVVHVERLELSRAGTALLTSTSESIIDSQPIKDKVVAVSSSNILEKSRSNNLL
ncbi:hypothetical protein J2W23_005185 [Variovorax boronicumulans]|uniref:hypothetical protein n=1 Tax=Variovorax boronicumulans TaxID=436515 RepID=UPI00277FB808|nr:hypothetical protein [Variovorax boronicumulans]MDQ0016777.1 hypothetical protein [Variovorax boronicumulans]